MRSTLRAASDAGAFLVLQNFGSERNTLELRTICDRETAELVLPTILDRRDVLSTGSFALGQMGVLLCPPKIYGTTIRKARVWTSIEIGVRPNCSPSAHTG